MLSNTRTRNARPGERDYKLTDFEELYLLICKNDGKLWRFALGLNDKQKQIAPVPTDDCHHYPCGREAALGEHFLRASLFHSP